MAVPVGFAPRSSHNLAGIWLLDSNSTVHNGSVYVEDGHQQPYLVVPDTYDYQGASLFVTGLLTIYGLAILLFIISLIRKSRTELEVVDHLEDFEALRRASIKRKNRDSFRKAMAPGPTTPPHLPEGVPQSIRPALRTAQRSESQDSRDIFWNYEGKRSFRRTGKIVSFNPGLLRDDTYRDERFGPDVIIL